MSKSELTLEQLNLVSAYRFGLIDTLEVLKRWWELDHGSV